MPRSWFEKTIARKLLRAFFLIFIITYLVTSLVVQNAVRTAVTDSELDSLSQLAHLKLNSLNTKFSQLKINLNAWSKLDVMNDLASGDVDKRVTIALANLKKDYAIQGQLYAFDATGHLVSSSDQQIGQHKKILLPDEWKSRESIYFVNKHNNPLVGNNIVALVVPIEAAFSSNYKLGTLVLAYDWSEISATLPDHTLLLYHKKLSSSPDIKRNVPVNDNSLTNLVHDSVLLESTLTNSPSDASLTVLTHQDGWAQVGNNKYLVKSASESKGLLSGWEVVMLREPETLYQTVHKVILKLIILGLILTMPLIFVIRWLASRLTAPLRELTSFVSKITGTHDLSKRLELHSDDEIGILAANFNLMTERLESGLRANRVAETRLRSTIENALDAVVQISSSGVVTGWNEQAVKIFGWARDEAIGSLLHELIIPLQYRENHIKGMNHFLATSEVNILNSRIEMEGLHRDGHEFPIELAITTIDVEGQHEFSAFIRDITIKKESEELIWNQANFDKVTSLPNRHMFHDRLEQEIKKAHRSNMKMALLFIDLDRFKEINDTLGHDMGDILLVEMARRIGKCVRESDTVARFGGDEFTVILSEINDNESVERVAQSILKILTEPIQIGDEVVYMSGSIGITLCPDDANTVDELLKNADQAMYVAKNQGRNQSSYFTSALQVIAQERRRLTHDLRGALESDQFLIYFQPIINLETGRIQKAEALIRWKHPERGIVDPIGFIILAEETGLIIDIGDWVFKESARWAKRWSDLYLNSFQISVNVSPVQFLSEDLSSNAWEEYLGSIGLTGKNMVLEITEGLLLKAASNVTDKLLKFRDSGIQVAIDDFGTGYSSLSYLKKFDIDYLKIDKSFVDNLEYDNNDKVLSEAIIVMAHKLGLKVIAEGVETEAQRNLLSIAGCDSAQGYLFSKPVPPDEFEELLKASI